MPSFKSRLRKLRRRLPKPRDVMLITIGVLLTLGSLALAQRGQEELHLPTSPAPLAAGMGGVDVPWLPPTVQRWKGTVNDMARKYNIDPDLLAIIMTVESGGNPKARSPIGAQGLMQVMPLTAGDIAKKHVKQPVAAFNLDDPKTNIEFGAAYLAHLRDHFGTNEQAPSWNETVELISAGYNGGPGAAAALEKGEGLRSMETVAYSRDVYNMWRERHAASSPTYDRWLERGGHSLVDKAASGQ